MSISRLPGHGAKAANQGQAYQFPAMAKGDVPASGRRPRTLRRQTYPLKPRCTGGEPSFSRYPYWAGPHNSRFEERAGWAPYALRTNGPAYPVIKGRIDLGRQVQSGGERG